MTSPKNIALNRLVFAGGLVLGLQWLAAVGCAPADSVNGGKGGASAGSAGSSGATGAAGTSSAGSAGTTGGGATTGSAGTTGSGATTGSAGTTGSGATTGGGGTSATTNTDPATFAYKFNAGLEGWTLNNYADTGRINLADPARAASPAPTLTLDTAVGNPDAGSLKATAHFSDWKQYIDAVINVSPPKMLTGRVLRARVRLTSGTFTGGVQIHAGTGSSYRFAAGTWTTMTVGNWIELAIDLNAAKAADAMFDPSAVVQIGVKFDTGGDGLTQQFGGAIDAIFQIDTVSDGVVGGTLPPAVNYTFDTDAQSWTLNNYDNTSRKNLGGPNSPTTPTLAWDGAAGMPSPGSLKLAVTYSAYAQYVDPALNLSSLDLTGKVLHAYVMLDSGFFLGGVQLHAGSGPNYIYASSPFTPFGAEDAWIEVTLDLTQAQTDVAGFIANDIRQIGLQFDTGDPGDGGGAFNGPYDAIFHIDSIIAQ